MFKWITRQCRNAHERLRGRGPLGVSLLILRELLSPLLYWHVLHIFEFDVQPAPTEPHAKARFDLRIYSGKGDLERLKTDVVPLGEVTAQEVELRLKRGDAVAVAYSGVEAVGYAWIAFTNGLDMGLETTWIIRPGEAVYYGTFTHPGWRGQRVQTYLDEALKCYARQRGVERILLSIAAFNRPSLGAAKHMLKREIMTVILVRLRGVNWTFRSAIGGPLHSRFSVRSYPFPLTASAEEREG